MIVHRFQLLLMCLAAMLAAGVGIGADRVDSTADATASASTDRVSLIQVDHRINSAVSADNDELMRDLTAESAKRSPKQLWMEVTAYCPCTKCCGPNAAGITASGLPVSHNNGRFVAADTTVLPFGMKLRIPGYHQSADVPVIDRGGAIKGNKLDVFYPTHDQALEWGRRWVLVAILG